MYYLLGDEKVLWKNVNHGKVYYSTLVFKSKWEYCCIHSLMCSPKGFVYHMAKEMFYTYYLKYCKIICYFFLGKQHAPEFHIGVNCSSRVHCRNSQFCHLFLEVMISSHLLFSVVKEASGQCGYLWILLHSHYWEIFLAYGLKWLFHLSPTVCYLAFWGWEWFRIGSSGAWARIRMQNAP